MAQPLPYWLKLVTLRYQGSDVITTGLVQLPITYSGPSIPLAWPYTSVMSDSLTASPPLSSSAPLSPEVVQFVDGGGPFTVLGDVILTLSEAIHPSPTTSTATMTATPTPSVAVVTTIVIAQPTPSLTSSFNNPDSSLSKPLEIGFVIMLVILIMLLFVVSVVLIKCHQGRQKHVSNIANDGDCLLRDEYDEFKPRLYSHDLERSPEPQHLSCNLREAIPTLLRQHASLNAQIQEKKLDPPEAQFLITPQRNPTTNAFGWMRWKKLTTKLQNFTKGRAVLVYDQPPHQRIPQYSNPDHDPSVDTDTGERVERWRMKCNTPSVLRLTSTITSNQDDRRADYKTPHDSFCEEDKILATNCIEFNDRNHSAEEYVTIGCNQISTICELTGEMPKQHHRALEESPLTPSQGVRTDPTRKSPECASLRRIVSKPQSHWTTKSSVSNALLNVSAYVTSSLGHTGAIKNISKGYPDGSPSLLTAECEGDDSESDANDEGSSHLQFHNIPLPSPSRCRRGAPPSSSAASPGFGNPIDSLRSSQSPRPPGSSLPIVYSAERVRRKTKSLTSSPRQSLSSPLALVNLRSDHSSAYKLTTGSSSHVSPLLPPGPMIFQKERGEIFALKDSNPTLVITRAFAVKGPSLEDNCRGRRSGRAQSSRGGSDSSIEMAPTSSKFPTKHQIKTFEQSLIPVPELNKENMACRNIHPSCGNDVNLSGYPGPRSIGNTGGVSELGNLETKVHDRTLAHQSDFQTNISFPNSVSPPPNPTSPPASSRLFDTDEVSCLSADLFYVKPQGGHALGRRKTIETSTGVKSNWEFTRNC